MEVLHSISKGKLMDTLERFHIYKITHKNIQINDKNTFKPKIIFETIVNEESNKAPHLQLTALYLSSTHTSLHSQVIPYTHTLRSAILL
jgi:hypothetical protein